MSLVERFNQFLANPTDGYRRSMFSGANALLYAYNGEPWFSWWEVPLMQQSPAVRFGLKLCRAPYATITLDEKKLRVPGKPDAKLFVQDCFKRFWTRGVPRLMDAYHCWGRGVLGVDYRFDPKRKIIRIKKVRHVEPFDAEPMIYLSGKRKNQFAGVNLKSGGQDRQAQFVSNKHVFFFAGFARLDGQFLDLPRIAGAVSPWKEQTSPAGAIASCRLFYWTRAVGAVEIRYPHGERLTLPDGTAIDAQDAARQFGERIMNGVVMAVPNDMHPTMPGKYKWEVEMRAGQSDTAGVLEYRDKLDGKIWMGMEIPEEIAFANERGSGFSGRAIPMESWLAGVDEVATMIWDEFREQHLDRLMRMNYGITEYDCPLTSLLAEFRESQKGQGGQKPGEQGPQPPGGDDAGPSAPPKPGQPWKGPRGGIGTVGPDGKVHYGGANLSTLPEGVKYDKRTKRLHAGIALAMCEAAMRKKMGSDAAGDSDELLRWLPTLAEDPEELGAALGAKMLGWVQAGTSKSGKPRWRNEETKQYRYQKSEPGTHSARRAAMQGTAKRGSEIVSKVIFGQHTTDELKELEGHFDAMTVPQLRSARARLGAAFANSRQRAGMVRALTDHVRQRVQDEAEAAANPEPPAEEKPKKLTGAAAKNVRRPDGTPVSPDKQDVFTVDPKALKIDPKRFQYKVSGIRGEHGVSDELKGTSTWNPELGGTLLVWRDPADGQDYVINGHHRHELANRVGAGKVNARYIDAKDAKEARARGALANIAEGRGTATDAAKYLRDSGQDIEHLKRAGVSMSGKVAADAEQLSQLSDKAFQDMTNGKIKEVTAVTVAKNLKDHDLQDKLFKLLDKREEDGKDWGPREIEAAAKKLARAGKVTTTESTLFGDLESEESTFEEEAELEAHIRAALNKTLSNYAAVSSDSRAEAVKEAGNVLNTEENKKRRQAAAVQAEDFEREAGYKSAVSDAIQRGAAELKAAPPKEKNAVKKRTAEAVQSILAANPGKPVASDAGGGGAGGGGAPGASTGGSDLPPPAANRPDGREPEVKPEAKPNGGVMAESLHHLIRSGQVKDFGRLMAAAADLAGSNAGDAVTGLDSVARHYGYADHTELPHGPIRQKGEEYNPADDPNHPEYRPKPTEPEPEPPATQEAEPTAKPDTRTAHVVERLNDKGKKEKLISWPFRADAAKKLAEGNMTAEELKAHFNELTADPAGVKAHLGEVLKKTGLRSPEKIAAAANEMYERALHTFALGKPVSYAISYGSRADMEGKKIEAFRKAVDGITDADIKGHADQYAGQKAAFDKAMTNPETYGEFGRFIDRKGEGALTPEQAAKWDEVQADMRRESDERNRASRAIVSTPNVGTGFSIHQGVHSKHGTPLHVVKLNDRVDGDQFRALNEAARRLGGSGYQTNARYSRGATPDGFNFDTPEKAEAFGKLISGESVSRLEDWNAMRDDTRQSKAARLGALGDRSHEAAEEELSRDRLANTHRRAAMAASAEAGARAKKAFGATAKRVAEHIGSGQAKHLAGVGAGTHLESLDTALYRAMHAADRKNDVPYEQSKGRTATPEDIAHAEYPYPFFDKGDLLRAAMKMKGTPGAKRLGERVRKVAEKLGDNGDYIKDHDFLSELSDVAKNPAAYGVERHEGDVMKYRLNQYMRLHAADIKNPAELRAALREYLPLKQNTEGADPIKEAERGLVGKKIPGFFPTPRPVIDDMLDRADIQPGMKVLEPSAGKGDILDAVKERHPDADTEAVEPNMELRTILNQKGHALAGNDFLQHAGQYDRIVMNPPFENGQDMAHVRHAFDQLKPGGKLVAITSEGPFFRDDAKSKEFRDWLDSVGGESESMPEGSFAGNDAFRKTGVRTRMVTISK